jgi:predicted aldo/keto reductase-like oxidoreductase
MPCPNGVEIQRIFQLYNDAVMYDDMAGGKYVYVAPFGPKEEERGDKCIECEECLEKCPQQINIPEWLKKAHEALMPEG